MRAVKLIIKDDCRIMETAVMEKPGDKPKFKKYDHRKECATARNYILAYKYALRVWGCKIARFLAPVMLQLTQHDPYIVSAALAAATVKCWLRHTYYIRNEVTTLLTVCNPVLIANYNSFVFLYFIFNHAVHWA